MARRRSTLGAAAALTAGMAWPASAPGSPSPGLTERVSVDGAGGQADVFVAPGGQTPGSFRPVVSGDGRVVAFSSNAADLVPGDTNGAHDAFVRDRRRGTTERVSVTSAGREAHGSSGEVDVDGRGRVVAFTSEAGDLAPGDTNGVDDVFVRDRRTGRTERVSVAVGGGQLAAGAIEPSISADGRFVTFRALTPAGGGVILVRDRLARTTAAAGAPPGAPGGAFSPTISGDGRVVAFPAFTGQGTATTLWVWNRRTGALRPVASGTGPPSLDRHGRLLAFATDAGVASVVTVVDRRTGSSQPIALGIAPALSADGRFVAFFGPATGRQDVLVRDLRRGSTEVASPGVDAGPANNSSAFPSLSADGRVVAFDSDATNLVPGDTNGARDAFARDRGRALGHR
jgi:Tol biopolymer transport system component